MLTVPYLERVIVELADFLLLFFGMVILWAVIVGLIAAGGTFDEICISC